MSNYNHIHPDILDTMELNSNERIEFLYSPFWIGYPKSLEIIKYLNSLISRPKKPRMDNLLIVGESNIGKTTLITHFSELHPDSSFEDDDEVTRPRKPVIVAEAPASADERGLYSAILDSFWTSYRATDTVAKLRHQVIHLMRKCHVQILILDEMHNLLAGTPSKQRLVMNSIKSMGNILNIPIVGVGTIDAYKVISYDPQLVSRFDVIKLEKWLPNSSFQRLLSSFEQRLPLKNKSDLHTKELGKRLYEISDGNLGDLHKLLIECSKEAILTGTEKITIDIIDKYKWYKPTKGKMKTCEL